MGVSGLLGEISARRLPYPAAMMRASMRGFRVDSEKKEDARVLHPRAPVTVCVVLCPKRSAWGRRGQGYLTQRWPGQSLPATHSIVQVESSRTTSRAPPPYRRETIREREGVTPSHLPSSNPQKRKTPAGSPQPAFCLRSAKAYSAAIAGSAM
jgi:hypothetical protein